MGALFSYPFFRRALLAGILIALCAALLGVNLVLRRFSMLGDGLSHVGFGTLSIAAAAGVAPMAVAVPVVILAAFLLLRLQNNGRIKGDAAIALTSSSALAVGLIAASLSHGGNVDLHGYLFGSVLAVTGGDLWLCAGISAVTLALYTLCYRRLFAVTFDAAFARATGLRVGNYQLLLALLTAVTVVVGMRMMGALLISALLIFPALSAMRVCRSYRGVVLTAAATSVCCFALGLVLSFLWNTPVGATVVVTDLAAFLLACCLSPLARR